MTRAVPWRHLAASLGSVYRPTVAVKDALADLGAHDPAQITSVVARHKVSALAYERVRDLDQASSDLSARLSSEADIHHERQKALSSIEQAVDAYARDHGFGYGISKGRVMRTLYDDPTLRHAGDVDLYSRHVDEAWPLALHLLDTTALRFHPTELPWLKRNRDGGELYGQVKLVEPGGYGAIDIHFGLQSVRHCGRIAIPVPASPGIVPMDRATTVALVVVNSAGDHLVLQKDLNDLARAFDSDVDWSAVVELVERAQLGGHLRYMLDQLAQRSPDHAEAATAAAKDLPRGDWEPGPGFGRATPRRRTAATVLHAARVEMRGGPLRAAHAAATAGRYYTRRLDVRSSRGQTARMPTMSVTSCVRLVPIGQSPRSATAPVPGSRIVHNSLGEVVVGDLVFWPTVSGRIPAGALAAHQQYRQSTERSI